MINEIIKKTFRRLKQEKIEATPDMYRKYFCQEANKLGLYTDECNSINSLEETLSYKNRMKLKKLDIHTMDDLLNHLIKEFEEDESFKNDQLLNENSSQEPLDNQTNINLADLVSIVKDALNPSIGNMYSKEVEELNKNIMLNPEILSTKETQDYIHQLTLEREQFDKRALTTQLEEQTFLINNMLNELTKIFKSNNQSTVSIDHIKKTLENTSLYDVSDLDKLKSLKNSLIIIASELDTQSHTFNTALKKEKNYLTTMLEKIKNIEKRMEQSEESNNEIDFLTSAYSQIAYEKFLHIMEDNYLNNKVDYCGAVIDIDRFDKIEKQYGFSASDHILSIFAKLLIKIFGHDSKVCRCHGNTFFILIPSGDLSYVSKQLINVRKTIENAHFTFQDKIIKITISGSLCTRSHYHNQSDMVNNLHTLVQYAKENGRNIIEICTSKHKVSS